jgi:hypothetical protein
MDQVVYANFWAKPAHHADLVIPAMPSPDGDHLQPRWEEIKPGPLGIENPAATARNASRDRDSQETIDHEPQREASDIYILRHQDSWPKRLSGSGSDMQLEYANAVRQMTNEMARDHETDINRVR